MSEKRNEVWVVERKAVDGDFKPMMALGIANNKRTATAAAKRLYAYFEPIKYRARKYVAEESTKRKK